jgi:hypothetical protein
VNKPFICVAFSLLLLGLLSCTSGEKTEEVVKSFGTHALPGTRTVELTCTVTVKDIPQDGKRVTVWIPFPKGNEDQRLLDAKILSPASYPPEVRHDSKYFYPVLIVRGEMPLPPQFNVSYTARVKRTEIDQHRISIGAPESDNAVRRRFAVELTPWSDNETSVLRDIVAGLKPAENTPPAMPRAIFDWVNSRLSFDNSAVAPKTLTETLTSGKGGARDYASLVGALLRVAGYPSRVETGFLLPEARTSTPVELREAGVWVSFYVNGFGWVWCDPCQADRFPELSGYLFAGLSANVVALGMGPWPGLDPAPKAPLPIYLIRPYAEVDGKPVTVESHFTFKDVLETSAGGGTP